MEPLLAGRSMPSHRRVAVGATCGAVALLLLCIVVRPGAVPGELKSARPGGHPRVRVGQGRLEALMEGKPANTPESFSRTAERVRIESAIQIAAKKLEQEKEHKARLEAEHNAALEEYNEKAKLASDLRARSAQFAQEAVEKRTVARVEGDKAETDGKEEELETKIAELMAYKASNLRERAAAQLSKEHSAAARAEELRRIVEELERMAHEKGQHADAVVRAAHGLLASAREMAHEAERQAGVELDSIEGDAAREPLLARMRAGEEDAKKEMEADERELAEAQLKLKNLRGTDGVDPTSRAQEEIQEAGKTADILEDRSLTSAH